MAFRLFGKKKLEKRRKIKHIVGKKAKRKIEKVKRKVEKEVRIVMDKLPDEKAYEIVRKFKIPVAETIFVKKQDELEKALRKVGYPCVMKVSGSIIHKTEVGGVVTNIGDRLKAIEVFNRLIKIKEAEKVIVQKQIQGEELIIGSKKDSQFGYVVVAGLGGVFVETLKDVVFRTCPISLQDAEEMIKELKGYDILKGARGSKPINFSSLYEIITKISHLTLSEKMLQGFHRLL